MGKTIMVEEGTHTSLHTFQQEFGAGDYDETIRMLANFYDAYKDKVNTMITGGRVIPR